MEDLCSLRVNLAEKSVEIIDQTLLPHQLKWISLNSLDAYCVAIATMQVRGAPLIGITAAFGLASALSTDASDKNFYTARANLLATRPTAVNLAWAIDQVTQAVHSLPEYQRAESAFECACALRFADIKNCSQIGEHGKAMLSQLFEQKGSEPLHIMTHCNAGWLATIEWGTALAPLYKAHAAGLNVHVWVSETRPRNQGAFLTAWELHRAGVPCTLVADNSCGHLMQEGKVDCVIVGSDRTAANGDVCNKIGTYLKALAARDNGVPFYAAVPTATIDWSCVAGADIPIEVRDNEELLSISGLDERGQLRKLRLGGVGCHASNPAFDVTPAALVTGLITEHGLIDANTEGLTALRSRL